MEIKEVICGEPLPLVSLNHVSLLVKCVWESVRFYEDVLGFCNIKRPSSFNFHGAWLYNYGIGIHLLENEFHVDDEYDVYNRPINPKDNHISFQCTDVGDVKMRLEELGIRFVTAVVEEEGSTVDQVFFHDPDGYMIEICNCEEIPITPIISSSECPFRFRRPLNKNNNGSCSSFKNSINARTCGLEEETLMLMECLSMDMINFSF